MREYFDGKSRLQLMKKYKLSSAEFTNIRNKYQVIVEFNDDLFFEALRHAYKNHTISKFCTKFGVSSKAYHRIKVQINVSYTKMMEWLDIFKIPYTKTVVTKKNWTKENHSINLDGYVDPVIKKDPRKDREMSLEEIQEYIETNSLIECQKNVVRNIMTEKKFARELEARIMNHIHVIAREAVLMGIKAERNQYGEKLESKIMKEIGGRT